MGGVNPNFTAMLSVMRNDYIPSQRWMHEHTCLAFIMQLLYQLI